jgi:Putative zinc-finger
MTEHVTEWLSPYSDGELHSARLSQVEQHLSECAECQNELEEMKELSALLHEAPPTENFLPAERFVSNLKLSLPRQPEHPRSGRILEMGWWLIPLSLLGAWLFLQVTFSLSSAATVASDTGLLGGSFSWLQGHTIQGGSFIDTIVLFGNQIGFAGQSILSLFNEADVIVSEWTRRFLWEALLAFAYLGWLFSWWVRHPEPPAQNSGSFSHS